MTANKDHYGSSPPLPHGLHLEKKPISVTNLRRNRRPLEAREARGSYHEVGQPMPERGAGTVLEHRCNCGGIVLSRMRNVPPEPNGDMPKDGASQQTTTSMASPRKDDCLLQTLSLDRWQIAEAPIQRAWAIKSERAASRIVTNRRSVDRVSHVFLDKLRKALRIEADERVEGILAIPCSCEPGIFY